MRRAARNKVAIGLSIFLVLYSITLLTIFIIGGERMADSFLTLALAGICITLVLYILKSENILSFTYRQFLLWTVYLTVEIGTLMIIF